MFRRRPARRPRLARRRLPGARHAPASARPLEGPADEYARELSPEPELLKRFLAEKRRHGGDHNYPFHVVGYERRFHPPPAALEKLKALAERSRAEDVYLICQCGEDERCHRELLLLLARTWHGAATEPLRFAYPVFESRLRRDGLKPALGA